MEAKRDLEHRLREGASRREDTYREVLKSGASMPASSSHVQTRILRRKATPEEGSVAKNY
jgi:hypothetical protein